ncbi:MAG: rRNA maturation RNase YbeY [Syntrophales bacterium]|jgi:probable rRNA maturation factor|nr:rRNA maturation RNase YbeY [Syntrophales bacterium]
MTILIENRQKKITLNRRQVRNSLVRLLKRLGLEDRELSLLLVDNEEIRELNRLYLGRDYPTNVISFSMSEGAYGDVNPQLLGDIIISVEKAMSEGETSGASLKESLDFLMIHGLLHLLGYDHESGDTQEARRMQDKEEELFLYLNRKHVNT